MQASLVDKLGRRDFPSTPESFSILVLMASLSFGLFTPATYGTKDVNLLGQHTVRMSPISTAQLNPNGHTFCLSPSGSGVLIPILLNNTSPLSVKYTLMPLGYTEESQVESFELSPKDLKAIEDARISSLPANRAAITAHGTDDYDEYDDDEDSSGTNTGYNIQSTLQKTQSLVHLRITKPGTLRLIRVLEGASNEARIVYPAEVTVVPCPRVHFVEDVPSAVDQDVRCARQNSDLELKVDIYGVPPLTLRWIRRVDGTSQHFLVEGIESGHDHPHQPREGASAKEKDEKDVARNLRIPLTVSLELLGLHVYALEEIVDGFGNVVQVGHESHSLPHLDPHKNELDRKPTSINLNATRSLVVLRRPTVSFQHCQPGHPTSLLICSEAPLTISAHDSDALDAPWEVVLKYRPIDGDTGKRLRSWKKTFEILQGTRELVVKASAPGEYTILTVKGKVSLV